MKSTVDKDSEIIVHNTICSATKERQEAAKELSAKSGCHVGDRWVKQFQHTENCMRSALKIVEILTLYKRKEDLENSDFSRFDYVGITAGASTQIILLRRFKNMSEMSFEQMLEESLKTIRNGEVVEGTVIDVKPDEIILNIGYKSDGIITRNEYTNDSNVDLTTVVSVGDTMEAKVLKVNDGEGQVLLTYKRLAAEKGSERLKRHLRTKKY